MELEYDSKPFTLDIGDFNGDNKLDMPVGNSGSDCVSILLQTC